MSMMLSILFLLPHAVLLVVAVVVMIRRRRIPERALEQTAREAGVSVDYLRATIANNDDCAAGRIDGEEWVRRAMAIAYRHPVDSGIRDMLKESEGLQ